MALAELVASQAESIVNTLTETVYQYDEHIDAQAGIFDCDCSGFVGWILALLAAPDYTQLPIEPGHKRPRAFEYFVFLDGLHTQAVDGWAPVDALAAVQRGDIIAWRTPQVEVGEDTGHVFFVAEPPIAQPSGTFAVRIYDSADHPHFEDTRGSEPGRFPTGVGSGFINFQVDATGAPIAFQFAPGTPFTTLPIRIGRLTT